MNRFFSVRIERLFCMIMITLLLMPSGLNLFAGSPDSLEGAVDVVKLMLAGGKSSKEIARWVTDTVDRRIVSLNLDAADEKKSLNDAEYRLKKEVFDAWSKTGEGVDEPFASAHWTWNNRAGHCQENAHMAYHILMMALKSGENIRELSCGDHIYVVWGVPADFSGQVSIADLNRWKNAFIIDPWQGLCKATTEVGRTDWALTKGGFKDIYQSSGWSYETYWRRYQKWLQTCDDFSGTWGQLGDRFMVTAVSGNANIRIGQFMDVRPAGIFGITRTNGCTIRLKFRASELEGRAYGRIATLDRVISGNITTVHLAKVKLGGRERLKVVMVAANPSTGLSITREGLLSK